MPGLWQSPDPCRQPRYPGTKVLRDASYPAAASLSVPLSQVEWDDAGAGLALSHSEVPASNVTQFICLQRMLRAPGSSVKQLSPPFFVVSSDYPGHNMRQSRNSHTYVCMYIRSIRTVPRVRRLRDPKDCFHDNRRCVVL